MQWIREGTAWVYGDHLCGDDLIGGPVVVNSDIYDPEALGKLLLKDLDPGFQGRASPGDFIVAGVNLGFSKAHQQFYLALKGFGIGGVIAASFQPFLLRALPFYGIPFLTLPGANKLLRSGERLTVDFRQGTIMVQAASRRYQGEGVPEILASIYQAGSQLAYLRQKLAGSSANLRGCSDERFRGPESA